MRRYQDQDSYRVADFLSLSKPPIPSILRCGDVQSVWRSKNKQLMEIFTTKDGFHQIISTMHTTKDFQIVRHTLGLFMSPNTALLKFFAEDVEYSEHILEVFERPRSVHRYVIGVIMQILLKAFDSWPSEMLEIFHISRKNYPRIAACLHLPAVYHFAFRIVTRSEDVKTFIWIIFTALMDAHGTGAEIPRSVNRDVVMNANIPRLIPNQRKKALQVLCNFFNEFVEEDEIAPIVSQALPLMLQDACDDIERSWVLRLGLNLEPEEGIGHSVLSTVNIYKSSDILIQYSLLYIANFDVAINEKSIEFFIYRLLKRIPNNFVLVAATKMLRRILDNEQNTDQLQDNIRSIVNNAINKYPQMKSVIMRAFRVDIVKAAEGVEMDPSSRYCADQIRRSLRETGKLQTNVKLIQELENKDQLVSANNAKEFMPNFEIVNLWKNPETLKRMAKAFKSLTRLPHLDIKKPEPVSRPLPRPELPPVKHSRNKSLEIFNKNQLDFSTNESKSDDEDIPELAEIDVSPRKQVPFTKSTPIIDVDDDDDFDLPEIDVRETLSSFQSRVHPEPEGPLTDEVATHEPIPQGDLPRELSPLPKLNPESPRSIKRIFVQDDQDFMNDSSKPQQQPAANKLKNPPMPTVTNTSITATAKQQLEDEEEWEYEYEEEDIIEEEPQRQILDQKIPVPILMPAPIKEKTSAPVGEKVPTTPPRGKPGELPGTPPRTPPRGEEPELEELLLTPEKEKQPEFPVPLLQPAPDSFRPSFTSPQPHVPQQRQPQKSTPSITSPQMQQLSPPKAQPQPKIASPVQLGQLPPPVKSPPITPPRAEAITEASILTPRPKVSIGRHMLVIQKPEVPDYKEPLTVCRGFSVEKMERKPPQPSKPVIAAHPRIFYSYDDEDEEEEVRETNIGPFIEEVIPKFV